jgi:DNA-binding beta-propeller fold protein YncE
MLGTLPVFPTTFRRIRMIARTTATLASMLLLTVLAAPAVMAAPPSEAAAMRQGGRVELPGYTGDFDHFGVDVAGNRLFLAAEDHGTIEVFELGSGKHLKTIAGVEQPHGVLYLAGQNRLLVTDSGAGYTKVFDATSYQLIDAIKLAPGADSMAYDPAGKFMYIVTGGKNGQMKESFLVKVDPRTGKQVAQRKFDTDKVEAMAVERKGNHLYVNVTGKDEIAVLDKVTLKVLKTWPVSAGKTNAAMAFDEAHARLFVVTRKPYQLLVLDTATGATVATFAAPERTNEAIYDERNHRIYLAGDHFINVIQQAGANQYEALAPIATAKGAKTAIYVSQLNRLFAAVSPGEDKTVAAVLRFDVTPSAGASK